MRGHQGCGGIYAKPHEDGARQKIRHRIFIAFLPLLEIGPVEAHTVQNLHERLA